MLIIYSIYFAEDMLAEDMPAEDEVDEFVLAKNEPTKKVPPDDESENKKTRPEVIKLLGGVVLDLPQDPAQDIFHRGVDILSKEAKTEDVPAEDMLAEDEVAEFEPTEDVPEDGFNHEDVFDTKPQINITMNISIVRLQFKPGIMMVSPMEVVMSRR